jgi:hypothetical protein
MVKMLTREPTKSTRWRWPMLQGRLGQDLVSVSEVRSDRFLQGRTGPQFFSHTAGRNRMSFGREDHTWQPERVTGPTHLCQFFSSRQRPVDPNGGQGKQSSVELATHQRGMGSDVLTSISPASTPSAASAASDCPGSAPSGARSGWGSVAAARTSNPAARGPGRTHARGDLRNSRSESTLLR